MFNYMNYFILIYSGIFNKIIFPELNKKHFHERRFFFYFLEEVMTMSGIEIAALSWFPIHFTGLVNHSGE